jgi:hypothetical protein
VKRLLIEALRNPESIFERVIASPEDWIIVAPPIPAADRPSSRYSNTSVLLRMITSSFILSYPFRLIFMYFFLIKIHAAFGGRLVIRLGCILAYRPSFFMPCGIQSKTLSLFECGGTLFCFGTFHSCVRNILCLEIGEIMCRFVGFSFMRCSNCFICAFCSIYRPQFARWRELREKPPRRQQSLIA